MNPKQTLQALIDQTKKMPNGLERNKLVSHLENARLIAALMEYQTADKYGVDPYDLATIGDKPECICEEGAIDRNCLLHGGV